MPSGFAPNDSANVRKIAYARCSYAAASTRPAFAADTVKIDMDWESAVGEALAKKRPLFEDTSEERLAEFCEHFGDLDELEEDFLRQMTRVK